MGVLRHLMPRTYKINSRWIEHINMKKQNFKMFKRKYSRIYKIVKFLYTHVHICTILCKCVSVIMYVHFALGSVFLLGSFLPHFPRPAPRKSAGPPASALARVSHTSPAFPSSPSPSPPHVAAPWLLLGCSMLPSS